MPYLPAVAACPSNATPVRAGAVGTCVCNPFYTPLVSMAWVAANSSWAGDCAVASCPVNSAPSNPPGSCNCTVGAKLAVAMKYNEQTRVWTGSCSRMLSGLYDYHHIYIDRNTAMNTIYISIYAVIYVYICVYVHIYIYVCVRIYWKSLYYLIVPQRDGAPLYFRLKKPSPCSHVQQP